MTHLHRKRLLSQACTAEGGTCTAGIDTDMGPLAEYLKLIGDPMIIPAAPFKERRDDRKRAASSKLSGLLAHHQEGTRVRDLRLMLSSKPYREWRPMNSAYLQDGHVAFIMLQVGDGRPDRTNEEPIAVVRCQLQLTQLS